jgi:chromosome partitioning protein
MCITNQKGGVGKTTTAISVTDGLARKNKPVALIDLDPQCQAAVALGMTPEPGVYWLLARDRKGNKWPENGYAKQVGVI